MIIQRVHHIFLIGMAITFAGLSTSAVGEETVGDRGAKSEQEHVQQLAQEYNQAQDDEGSKVVCRKESVTGSRFKKTVCRTVAVMDREQERARRLMDRTMTSVERDR